ncbi:zinc ribbon domain-containing protein [uncultured Oscillibacter sp.]|uniref:zinc ribbon domain-containing protein n=1 Tax=uncultured Oscillibacter sp. TaxID=876091 RepID=UPI0025F2CAA0|nr:zinc ribbon domain-containing protein [uncultured Oscillibacter sp.]
MRNLTYEEYTAALAVGVCAPIVAFVLLFVIANVVGFLKEHWEKARRYVVFLIINLPFAAITWASVGRLLEHMASENSSEIISSVMQLILIAVLLLYANIEGKNILNEMRHRNDKVTCPDTASVFGQSDLTPKAELRDYLEEPVNDFPWLRVYTEAENRRGLLALRELAQRIRSRRGQLLHCGYLFHIFTAERALAMGQYSLACHELLDVVHFYQAPEVTALIYKMLEPYLNEVTPVEQAAKRKCCPHCGNQCQDKDRYCRICGERLFKRFPELSEKDQAKVAALIECSIDAYLADRDEADQNAKV